jgi:Tfp pilus assembly protein FimT
MIDVSKVRRKNLRRLVNEYEGMNNLARKLGLARGAYISQLLTDPPVRVLSEKTARKWEKQLRLSEGWLDGDTKSAPASPLDQALLERVITELLSALDTAKVQLKPAKLADLIVMQYADAVALGRFDRARVQKIVGLFKG